jgi:uncharacterized protein (TIGR02391 family)
MLITSDQVDELLSTLADLSGIDDELVDRCGFLFRTERYDEAVGRAFVVLEERLRKLMGVQKVSGGQLVDKLFFAQDSSYRDRLRLPEAEVRGLRDIFAGSFSAFRNRAAHTVAGYSQDEARGIIQLVNLLLLVLEQIDQAPKQLVSDETGSTLGPVVTQRLNAFLSSLRGIGILPDKGKASIPYKARLRYSPPTWEEPRSHSVTVFYLTSGKSPKLAFNTGSLTNVPGLDVEELTERLLQAGCSRTSALKSVPLVLEERNDQATFDRLYEILEDLMSRHRVA